MAGREAMTVSPGEPHPFVTLGLDAPALVGRTGRGVQVAVLDSGVNPDNPHVHKTGSPESVDEYGEVTPGGSDRLGHGTAVTAVIQEKAPEAGIQVVRVFHEELATTVLGLARALDLARERGCRVVNLSLGTPEPRWLDLLGEAVERAVADGILLVSPREHRGRRWWPGSFPGVMGVLLDDGCPRHAIRLMAGPGGEPVIRASGFPRPIPGVPPERNLRGISFASANATGILCRLLEAETELRGTEEVAERIRDLGIPS
ncbi:MAG: hypothetical protein EA421_17855 [Gemmatimonadales bacterium]|nr:MAG: hypothetical protein EA421_17855 [Gemmatimonadales bacterium]